MAGTNVVSFAIDAEAVVTGGLLGFAVERYDSAENERYYMQGFKVFPSVIPNPGDDLVVSTYEHPVQSFVWDDFTAKPERTYEYSFHPVKGTPKNLDRTAAPVTLTVQTEPLSTRGTHDVFFNRGVASSQAYRRKFGNRRPDTIEPPALRQEAFDWLSRDLDEALLRFIDGTRKDDGLLCCFYEFRYRPVADALVQAIERGVDVRLIVDGKRNGSPAQPASSGKKARKAKASFPRDENLEMLVAAGFPKDHVTLRQARTTHIQHNKFMVWLKSPGLRPAEVWTGSTNLSQGGIFGQANVGHWLRDGKAAENFRRYWLLLSEDPGGTDDDSTAGVRKKNLSFRSAVEKISPAPKSLTEVGPGVTVVFSPRSTLEVLELYVKLFDGAEALSCVTLAFGISRLFKGALSDNTPESHLALLLLEKRDMKKADSTTPFIDLNWRNNVYEAWGSYLSEPLHQWAKETSAKVLRLNSHVAFIHSKFLLADPLGADPVVVTGSANFSEDSTKESDENMLIIRGDRRVADIYFTEFNRLFNHYYFRAVREAMKLPPEEARERDLQTLFLAENDAWLAKYGPRSLRRKRVQAIIEAADDD